METNLEVPSERPQRVTRAYLVHLIRPAFALPEDLLPAAADYLQAKGVIANNDAIGYHLPCERDALSQVPEEAARAMHRAILAHCETPQCPVILKQVIRVMPSGGSGSTSQQGPRGTGGRTSFPRPPVNYAKDAEAAAWNRARHIAELADFGPGAAERVLDLILARLSDAARASQPQPAKQVPANPRPMVEQARVARKDLITRLRPVAPSLGDDLVEPLMDYLVAKGVIIHHGEQGYSLAALGDASQPQATLDTPGLHSAVLWFLKSQDCPSILKYVITAKLPSAGDAVPANAPGDWYSPPTPDFSGIVRELREERDFQIAALQPLDPDAAADLFEHVLSCLANPKPPPPRQRSSTATWVPDEQNPWPRTGQVEWAEVLASVEDDRVRRDFRALIDRHRTTGQPADYEILNALRDRLEFERLTASLGAVLSLPNGTATEQCQRWTALIEWGQRTYQRRRDSGTESVHLDDATFAHGIYPDGPLSIPLRWATETRTATVALRPLAVAAQFAPADLTTVHALVRDLDRILQGDAVDIRPAVDGVRLIVAEVEAQQGSDFVIGTRTSEVKGDVPTSPMPVPESGHWVPVIRLVIKDDERFNTPAKVTAFCKTHRIATRPGLTKAGKPWPRRRDVHLESWNAKVAALEAEESRLKDAADRRTADRKQLGQWAAEDQTK